MKSKLWFLFIPSLFLLLNCTRTEVNQFKLKDTAYIKFIATNPFDSLVITTRDFSFFPMTACLPKHTIVQQKGDYYESFRISKPELFSVRIIGNYFIYMVPGDTLEIELSKINNETSINVVINDPVFKYFQDEYNEYGDYYFRSPVLSKYYNSKPNSEEDLESAMISIDSLTLSKLQFLKERSNSIPSWFAEAQKAEYSYLAAHLKFMQHFLFHEKKLGGDYPSIKVKLNNSDAILSGYYFLFLSDYFLLPYLNDQDNAKGPSLMINLYNKASSNIHKKLKGEVLKSFQKYTLVTLYNACKSEEDVEIVDRFAESKNFNFSPTELSFIAFEKSEVAKNLKNLKERSNTTIIKDITFRSFPNKSMASESIGRGSSIQNSVSQDEVYIRVEENPEFMGGLGTLKEFIKKNLIYPNQCKEAGIQGRVLIMMIVEKDGSISNPRVVHGVDTLLDDEALRLANLLPKFKPGMDKGSPVRVEIVIPIDFEL